MACRTFAKEAMDRKTEARAHDVRKQMTYSVKNDAALRDSPA